MLIGFFFGLSVGILFTLAFMYENYNIWPMTSDEYLDNQTRIWEEEVRNGGMR